jgi:hypothetical protein
MNGVIFKNHGEYNCRVSCSQASSGALHGPNCLLAKYQQRLATLEHFNTYEIEDVEELKIFVTSFMKGTGTRDLCFTAGPFFLDIS